MDMLEVRSPHDNQVIDKVPLLNRAEIEAKLTRAQSAFLDKENWLPTTKRLAILQDFSARLQTKRDYITHLASLEGGKPIADTQIEFDRAINGIDMARMQLLTHHGSEIPMDLSHAALGHQAHTICEPIGVVFAISAFNHPINLFIHQVVTAVAVGCPVLIKPASYTPLTVMALVQLLKDCGLSSRWCDHLICTSEEAQRVASDSRVQFLTFIGSSQVGWYLRSQLAPGTHCALEHGGAAPMIVHEDAHKEQALSHALKGAFYHAGQVCVSTQRIFVHQKLFKGFSKSLAEQAEKLVVGDPLSMETQVGPLIHPEEVIRIHHWVKQAEAMGAKVLTGGEPIDDYHYPPTVLMNVPDTATLAQQEVFGPVVCINAYHEMSEAIRLANDTEFCFQSAVFTQDMALIDMASRHLTATNVMINESTAFRVDWMPFGGRKDSGLGVGGIPYTMKELTAQKMICRRLG